MFRILVGLLIYFNCKGLFFLFDYFFSYIVLVFFKLSLRFEILLKFIVICNFFFIEERLKYSRLVLFVN